MSDTIGLVLSFGILVGAIAVSVVFGVWAQKREDEQQKDLYNREPWRRPGPLRSCRQCGESAIDAQLVNCPMCGGEIEVIRSPQEP